MVKVGSNNRHCTSERLHIEEKTTQATLLSPAHSIDIEGKGAPLPLQGMRMQPQLTATQYNRLNAYYGHGREYLRDAKYTEKEQCNLLYDIMYALAS